MRYADAKCSYTEAFDAATGTQTYTFTGPCVITGVQCSVTVPAAGLFKYRSGALIQDAFPDLSLDDREFLMSGCSPQGWAETFNDAEEDEEEDDQDENADGSGSGDSVHEAHVPPA